MNNEIETREELFEEVVAWIDSAAIIRENPPTKAAHRIIALVRRQAWQEFEAAMLSDKAIDAMRIGFVEGSTGRAWTGAITAALAAVAPKEASDATDEYK